MTNPKHKKATLTPLYGAVLLANLSLLPSSTAVAEEMTLEEVIVSAQKREESLQDTPIAVTAFSAMALQDKGIGDISEIANFTPNLVFDTTSPISGLSSGAAVFIRGIGNTDFSLTTDPGVGTYVDGVYMSRSVGGVLDVLDIERIEVLRGPQGTLFGRNTIGGAMSITSRKPAEEFQGSIELTAGNLNRLDFRGSVDIPITDQLRTTFAFSSKHRDGYVDRVLVGDKLGDEERLSFRASATYELNDQWDFQLSLDHTKINEASSTATGLGFTTAFPDGTPGGAGVLGYGLFTFGNIAAGLNDLQKYISNIEDDKTFSTGRSGTKLEINGMSFIANLHFDRIDVKYTASLRTTGGEFFADPDNTPFSITEVYNPDYDHEQTSHELQITGSAFDERVKYAAGVYYFEETGTDNVFVPLFLPAPDLSAGFPAGLNNFADVDNSSEAGYIQATWDVTDIWSITGGVRHTKDSKRYDYTQYLAADIQGNPLPFFPGAVTQTGFRPGLSPLVGNGTGSVSDSFEETTYKFGVDATLSDGTLLYYSFSQGFKSGGFVLRYVAAVEEPLSFGPENINSHEVGVKWQGFDDRVRINAAAYYSEYDDIQVTFFDALGGPVTANAGAADIQGLEIELTAILTDKLKLEMGYGLTDAEYTSINPIAGLSSAINLSSKLVNTPKNNFNIGIEFATELGSNNLAARLDYSYTDEIYNDSQNSPFLYQDAIDVLNASLRYSIGDSTDLVLFVENLTDERYITSGNSNYGLGFHSGVVSKPREYGASFRYRF